MEGIFGVWLAIEPKDVVDITLLMLVIYRLLLLIKGTRTIPILLGLTVLLVTYGVSSVMSLEAIGWVMENLFSSVVIILVVLFQGDIRNALARVGMTTMFREHGGYQQSDLVAEIVRTAYTLARKRIGASIVMEHETGLKNFIERGRHVDAHPSQELMEAIFHTSSPLHDGAIIINREGRLAAARCILPLTSNVVSSSLLGTRHRSAIGITEETDAVVVVVSEERGEVSLAYQGSLEKNLEDAELRERIKEILIGRMEKENESSEPAPQAQPT